MSVIIALSYSVCFYEVVGGHRPRIEENTMSNPALAGTSISIIGAGPGGLVCARILQRHGIDVTVYDRDSGPAARNQGGSLDLHTDDGQLALREAGLIDEFWKLARPEGQQMRRWDTAGNVIAEQIPDESDTYKPEIDRGQLRELLLDSLTPDTVQWGRALAEVGDAPAGRRTLRFADGGTVETDLVIGADGIFSKVRAAVSSARAQYSGVTFLEAWFDDIENAHPEISKLVGGGSATATDGERALYAQRNSGDHIRVYIILRKALDWLRESGWTPEATHDIRAHLSEQFAQWGPGLRRMVTDNDGPYVDRPLWVLPAPHVWEHSANVTLLGDAAHLMPPIGVGVNLAMLDGCELALALVNSPSINEALIAYEATMLPRSTDLAEALTDQADFLLKADDDNGVEDRARELQEQLEQERQLRTQNTTKPGGTAVAAGAALAAGSWDLTFTTGGGGQTDSLILATAPEDELSLTGSYAGKPITDARIDGRTITFTTQISSPMKMKITCTGELDGDTIIGAGKSRIFTLPFTAKRLGD